MKFRLLLVVALTATLVSVAAPAQAATRAVTVPGNPGRVSYTLGWHYVPVLYIKYDWTKTVSVSKQMTTTQVLSNAACSFMGSFKAACALVVNLQANDIRNNVRYAIAHRRCLQVREPLNPPLGMFAYDTSTITCW